MGKTKSFQQLSQERLLQIWLIKNQAYWSNLFDRYYESKKDIELINNQNQKQMKRNLELTLEQAKKLYESQPEMRELLLTSFTEEELEGVVLKGWYDLKNIQGFYIRESSDIVKGSMFANSIVNINVFATKKQAKSALAMAQLSQLMKDLGDECDVDWEDYSGKHCICRSRDYVTVTIQTYMYRFLAFKTKDVCSAFLEKHERLIKDYFMID